MPPRRVERGGEACQFVGAPADDEGVPVAAEVVG